MIFPQGCGTIIIKGGTITATGGTWYSGAAMANNAAEGAAGIGSSEFSGATITNIDWDNTAYLNNVTGSITINGDNRIIGLSQLTFRNGEAALT